MSQAGTVRASLDEDAGFDDAGHGSAPSTSVDNIISWTPADPARRIITSSGSGD